LREHAASIQQATNLSLGDFTCRYLVVDDIWIPLAESLLISMFIPLWNSSLDGFGNHDPGAGRYNQQRSPWDEIHPGRSWAARLRPNLRPQTDILQRIESFWYRLLPPTGNLFYVESSQLLERDAAKRRTTENLRAGNHCAIVDPSGCRVHAVLLIP
jgi:Eco29kI-like restriction endonuclease